MKKIISVIIFISIVVQLNFLIDYMILRAIKNAHYEKIMMCPPDICTMNEEKTGIDFEILDLDLPPIPKI